MKLLAGLGHFIFILLVIFFFLTLGALIWAWPIMVLQGAIVGAGEWHMGYGTAVLWGYVAALARLSFSGYAVGKSNT